MAVEPEGDELLVEDQQDEGGNADEGQEQAEEQGSEEQGSDEDQSDEEEVISFGEEPAPGSQEADTPLIKHLRAELRETKKQLAAVQRPTSEPQKVDPGPKPTLADCEYDEDLYEQRHDEWKDRVAKAKQAESEAEKTAREANEAWQGEVRRFEAKRSELKVPGAQEAIETAISSLNLVQQAVIVKAADNPALVFAALGQHPGKLAEIASIQDPLKQAAAIAKLEGTLKVTKRRQAPDPEQIATGTARVSQGGTDKALERLEKEAARTNNYSKVFEYQRNQRRTQAAK